jgi:threonine dehydratase
VIRLEDIHEAREVIAPFVRRTRLDDSLTVDEDLGTTVVLKLEMFQKTGSFKVRGAFNKVLNLGEAEKRAGIIALSGGNFAQAIAHAGSTLGVRTRVLMPSSTPDNYVAATRSYGAEVELLGSFPEMFERIRQYQDQGLTFAHPYDDRHMMAGNGTLGLELLEDAPDLTDVVVSIGGGGLLAGVTTAVKSLSPSVRVWGVETEGAETMTEALRAGEPVSIRPTSLARTLGAPIIARDALRIAQDHLEEVIVVSDREAHEAQAFLLERAKLVTELAASCTLAAARRITHRLGAGTRVALVLCGGNVAMRDLHDLHARFIEHAA